MHSSKCLHFLYLLPTQRLTRADLLKTTIAKTSTASIMQALRERSNKLDSSLSAPFFSAVSNSDVMKS